MGDALLIAVISSGAFSAVVMALVTFIIKRIEKRSNKTDAISQGLTVLLEDRINFVATEYIKKGWVYQDDLDRVERMWKIYHNVLGGNGYLDGVMGILRTMPKQIRGVTKKEVNQNETI